MLRGPLVTAYSSISNISVALGGILPSAKGLNFNSLTYMKVAFRYSLSGHINIRVIVLRRTAFRPLNLLVPKNSGFINLFPLLFTKTFWGPPPPVYFKPGQFKGPSGPVSWLN